MACFRERGQRADLCLVLCKYAITQFIFDFTIITTNTYWDLLSIACCATNKMADEKKLKIDVLSVAAYQVNPFVLIPCFWMAL
jgi:hypothetical protein